MSPTDPTAAPAASDPGAPEPQAEATPVLPAVHAVDPDAQVAAAATAAPDAGEVSTDDLADGPADDMGDAAADPAGSPPDAGLPAAPRMNPAECAQALKARFPALFAGAPKPVKLRIQADIQAAAPGLFAKPVLSAFLRRHTGSTAYLIALSRATHRIDLAGQSAGEVSDEHRAAALEELARRRALVNERRAEEDAQRALADQQRRNRAGLLRDFERTTLTRANFCALKGVAEDALDGLLEIARREAAEAPPPAPERGRRDHRGHPGERGAGPRGDGERRGPGGPGGRRPDGGRPPRR